jgi:hypothetical protein
MLRLSIALLTSALLSPTLCLAAAPNGRGGGGVVAPKAKKKSSKKGAATAAPRTDFSTEEAGAPTPAPAPAAAAPSESAVERPDGSESRRPAAAGKAKGKAVRVGAPSSASPTPAAAPTPPAAPTAAPAVPVGRPAVEPGAHGGPAGCEFYGATACEDCLVFWAAQGNGMNNHFCKDKSRANGTKGWDCFNYAEDTSHGYQCIAYCPPDTPTCEENCNQKHADGSAYHDHPMRRTRNKNSLRVLGPPGYAPRKNEGKEERDQCNW